MSMKQTLIGLGLVAASGAALALPNIAVLATGGTIAGAGASATGTAYQAGKVSVNHLVAAVPELANIANVTPKQVAQIGSQDMSDEVWLKLARRSTPTARSMTASSSRTARTRWKKPPTS